MVRTLYNYEIVKRTMDFYKDRYMRITEISQLSGLTYHQVERIMKMAWKLGWVSRIETKHNNDNAWGNGEFTSCRTQYKIKRLDTWTGIDVLYKQIIREQKKRNG